jgi:hypothetical protein
VSRQDLVQAYVSGQIGRRAFVRGLVALGVSTSAAAAYAAALDPVEAKGLDLRDELYVPIQILQCFSGGFRRFGFRTQLQCVRAVLRRQRGVLGKQNAGGSAKGKKRKGRGKGRGNKN